MNLQFWFFQLLNGLTFGALLFLVASGFTLIFGMMRIVNLTHGVLYLLGGYVGLSIIRATDNFLLGLVVAVLGMGLLGVGLDRTLIRRMRGNVLGEVLLTIGVAFIFADIALMIWGGDPQGVPGPGFLAGALDLGIMSYPSFRLFVLVVGLVVAIVLGLLLYKTKLGAVIRAGVDDSEMVGALGINLDRVFTGVFLLGAMLAGLAGVLGGGFLSLYRGADADVLLFALVVVIIGGMGSLGGALLGSLAVGLVDAIGKALYPDIAYFTLFGPMAIMLALRPRGLFGREMDG
ncbi:MAG: branched-chain amino acid ABC transporter permease [Acidimicrobiia bacterium]